MVDLLSTMLELNPRTGTTVLSSAESSSRIYVWETAWVRAGTAEKVSRCGGDGDRSCIGIVVTSGRRLYLFYRYFIIYYQVLFEYIAAAVAAHSSGRGLTAGTGMILGIQCSSTLARIYCRTLSCKPLVHHYSKQCLLTVDTCQYVSTDSSGHLQSAWHSQCVCSSFFPPIDTQHTQRISYLVRANPSSYVVFKTTRKH